MKNTDHTSDNAFQHKRQGKDTKKDHAKRLCEAFYTKPISRRMAATKIGLVDQTYMVTQFVSDWIKRGKAQVVGTIKCSRSGKKVEAISTNPEFFKSRSYNQLDLFES